MGKKRSVKESGVSIPKAIGYSLIVSMITSLLGILAAAYLIYNEIIIQENMGVVVTVVLLLSSAASAITAINTAKRMRLQMSLLSGVAYYLLLLSVTALFFGGEYSGIVLTAVTILASCGIVAIGDMFVNKRGKSFKVKTAYR